MSASPVLSSSLALPGALATFFRDGTLGTPAAFLVAGLIGLSFGFWLERAGFGSSRKLTSIFYLEDFAVLKVMFTAIVTALLGLNLLRQAGLVDAASVHLLETVAGAQAVGGLLFGVGFVMGGWCPGTALVGAASGKGDALVFLGGALLGSLLYALAYPALGALPTAGACGACLLPERLGLSTGATVLLVVSVALGAFAFVEWLEARRAARTAGTGAGA